MKTTTNLAMFALLTTALAAPVGSASPIAIPCDLDGGWTLAAFPECLLEGIVEGSSAGPSLPADVANVTCPTPKGTMGYSITSECHVLYTEPEKLCGNGYYHYHRGDVMDTDHYHCP